MIAIISSVKSERTVLFALCESRRWSAIECDSVRAATRLLQRSPPKVLVVRHQLSDGFSDHVLGMIANAEPRGKIHCIVLIPAGTPATTEIRQIQLGADCVLRDPLRTGVLLAFLEKFKRAAPPSAGSPRLAGTDTHTFAGGSLHGPSRTLTYRQRSRPITPREVELIEALTRTPGQVVRYETLYSEILGRPFRGDTSNMRVLLRKLTASAATLGLPVRDWVEVIAKTGYRYVEPRPRGSSARVRR